MKKVVELSKRSKQYLQWFGKSQDELDLIMENIRIKNELFNKNINFDELEDCSDTINS